MNKAELKNIICECVDEIIVENSDILNEGFLSQLTMGAKIKPHQNIDVTLKSHQYPGFLNYIEKCNKIEDLKYLKKDVNNGINQFKIIRDRIIKCKELGECKETERYYKGIKKMYIDKGITAEDCDLTIVWFKENVYPAINNKIKELS